MALRGANRDGHTFLEQAARVGAAAALVDRPGSADLPQLVVADTLEALQACAAAERRRFPGWVCGVTGSCGKTSTKELLRLLLGAEGTLGSAGNFNNHLGVPLTLLRLGLETPARAVVEAGISQPGEMEVLARLIQPEAALITTVAPTHLAGLGSVAGVAAEKSVLAHAVPPGGLVVLGPECAPWAPFHGLPGRGFLACPQGTDPPPGSGLDPIPFAFSRDPSGVPQALALRFGDTDLRFPLPRMSEGMARNAVLALFVALHQGEEVESLAHRLSLWREPPLRGQAVTDGRRVFIVDCYNANPASLLDTVTSFRARYAGVPRLLVLGSMGELGPEAGSWHRACGKDLGVLPGEQVIVLGEHARSLAEGLSASSSAVHLAGDLDEVRARLEQFAGAILLKGSRSLRLEDLLPQGLPARENGERSQAC